MAEGSQISNPSMSTGSKKKKTDNDVIIFYKVVTFHVFSEIFKNG